MKKLFYFLVCTFCTLLLTSSSVCQNDIIFYDNEIEIDYDEEVYISDIDIPDGYGNFTIESYDSDLIDVEVMNNPNSSSRGLVVLRIQGKRGNGVTLIVGTVRSLDGEGRTLIFQLRVTVRRR